MLVLAGALWLWRKSEAEVLSRGITRIDLTRSDLITGPNWAPRSWSQTLRNLVAREGALTVDDTEALERLRADLEALPFVAQVGPIEVIWPDGLDVPIRLHEPLACLRVGQKFYPVAMIDDPDQVRGLLLPGPSDSPHAVGGGRTLPVLARSSDRAAQDPIPGNELQDGAPLAALDIARSMVEHLDRPHQAMMGRVLIDATRTHAFDGLPGGARLDLEALEGATQGRRIHFGDPPCEAGPGELPAALKWAHVATALERGFETVDVRFDKAEYHGREDQ